MESNHNHPIELFIDKAEKYVGLRSKLFAYKVLDKASELLSELLSNVIVIGTFILFFILLNLGVCIWVSNTIHSLSNALFLMAGFYLIIGVVLACLHKKWIRPFIANLLIKHILKQPHGNNTIA
jgi:hypothetical protein